MTAHSWLSKGVDEAPEDERGGCSTYTSSILGSVFGERGRRGRGKWLVEQSFIAGSWRLQSHKKWAGIQDVTAEHKIPDPSSRE